MRSPTTWWWYALHAGLVLPHVVPAPQLPEVVAAGGEFSDEVVQLLAVRVAAGFGAQLRDVHRGDSVPVRVEPARDGLQEDEPCEVRRGCCRADVIISSISARPSGVPGEQVRAAVADHRDGGFHGVEEPLHTRRRLPRSAPAFGAALRTCGRATCLLGEAVQVLAFRVIHQQRAGEAIQDRVGCTADRAALQAARSTRRSPRPARQLHPGAVPVRDGRRRGTGRPALASTRARRDIRNSRTSER